MSVSRPLAGRCALITGATGGIGAAVARRLGDAGAELHLIARGRNALRSAAERFDARAWPADLEEADALQDVLERIVRFQGGPPDILVNAVGIFEIAPFAETSRAMLDRALAANLRGPFLMIQTLLPGMLARGSGTIVTVGSVAGYRAFPNNSAYSASKFGVRGMHEVLAEELQGTGVRATLVEPGATDTPIWDPYRPDERPDLPDRAEMLRSEDVAEAVLFVVTRPAGVTLPLLRIRRG